MKHDYIPLKDFVALLDGYRSESTVKSRLRNWTLEGTQQTRIAGTEKRGRKEGCWFVDKNGEQAQQLLAEAAEAKALREAEKAESRKCEELAAQVDSYMTYNVENQIIIDKLRNEIQGLEKTNDELRSTIDKMEKQLLKAETERDAYREVLGVIGDGEKRETKPKKSIKRDPEAKAAQAEADAQMLAAWEEYRDTHEHATKRAFARSIDKPETTVASALKRATAARQA